MSQHVRKPRSKAAGIRLAMASATAALLFVPTQIASACSIEPAPDPPTVQQVVDEAELVAVARVVAEFEPFGAHKATYQVAFTEIWKGQPLPGTSVTVQDSSCGSVRYDVGDEILLVKDSIQDTYRVSMDWGLPTLAEILETAGDPSTPSSDPELFAAVNTHFPLPMPGSILDLLGLLTDKTPYLTLGLIALGLVGLGALLFG
ncbi:hypothetical protein SAMN02745244_03556 [Tessaracoccus bendigoensis DSM 12906]|uniref:Tissue inhibitor of metalloproteinase n=1 Tax=Tessaracoccus bendigoensis DSM 12906 TaxID=1123357 RepID=A0A1M6N5G9_9ACTN|nr:hypothetical protein [Tessaracoccus bendigoensis]SHJ90931.1 hypothetical protein SAMN02745244_03556 [Tessaracoccus bendigoensis DSM 12906]